MKALISKVEPRETGFRVAQVEPDDSIFETAPDFEWVTCPDNTVADTVWFDPETQTFNTFPEPEPVSQLNPPNTGVQTL